MAELRAVESSADRGESTSALAHLLAVLHAAADALDETYEDVDSNIVRAHAAELAAGRNWPGMTIRCGCGDCEPTPAGKVRSTRLKGRRNG